MQGLTKDIYDFFGNPFEVDEHRFISGNTYIDKEAIFDRLIAVDPNFEFGLVGDFITAETSVMIKGYMVVCGVRRENVGAGSITLSSDGKMPYGNRLSQEIEKAYKAAVTDLLQRIGQMYGIGRYLRNCPKEVKDHQSLARWLNGESPTQQRRVPAPIQAQAPAKPNGKKQAQAQHVQVSGNDDAAPFNAKVVSEDIRLSTAYNDPKHVRNTITKHFKAAGFGSMNHGQAVAWLQEHAMDSMDENASASFDDIPF